jgi:hypothetical protein
MHCYMCARDGRKQDAVSTCKYCSVGLCLEHLEDDYAFQYPSPRYSCNHPTPSTQNRITKPSDAHKKE